MPISITMPRLSDTMESGTIIKWNVKEGDKVSSGDVIADVETDKATMEMTAYDDGTVAKIAVPEGKPVSIGTVIAVLAAVGEEVAAAAASVSTSASLSPGANAAKPQARSVAKTSSDKPAVVATIEVEKSAPSKTVVVDADKKSSGGDEKPTRTQGNGRIFVSPMARRLAEEHRLELRSIEGSGPGGRIIKRDILKAVEAAKETTAAVPPSAREGAKPQAAQGEPSEHVLATRVEKAPKSALAVQSGMPGLQSQIVPLSNMRQTIAKRLVESKSTIPHYQVTTTIDMDPLLELRGTLNQQLVEQGVKLSVNDFIVRCCALAMYQHPEFNASFGGDHIEIHGEINIGIAISMPRERGGGLVVASIRNADQKSLRVISHESKVLAEKARTRGLTVQEMSDVTFTISNLGMFGIDNFNAIINPPNSAILAVGAAIKKPVVRHDALTIGHEMSATLSCDHRVIDGAMAAEYLQALKKLIENPATLLV